MTNEEVWKDAARKRDEDTARRYERAIRRKRAPRERKHRTDREQLELEEERRRKAEEKRGKAHEARDWFDKTSLESLADVERRGETSQLRAFLEQERRERERLRFEAHQTRRFSRGEVDRRRRYDDDTETRYEYRLRRERAKRAARIPPDRRCPLCARAFLRPQSWSPAPCGRLTCRGCAAALKLIAGDVPPVSRLLLRATREALGITRPALAAMSGYHRSYVQYLEGQESRSSGPAADRLFRAMEGWRQRAVDFLAAAP